MGSITVAIVTRNRGSDLKECLESLLRQSCEPKNILIVNNNSTDDTSAIIRRFSKKLSINEVIEQKIGFPTVYNRALNEAKTVWIAFIDDDCISDVNWYRTLVKATRQYEDFAAIAGSSLNYYPTNSYACAFQFSYEYWKLRTIKKRKINDYRVLDSRNIVYNRKLILKHHIMFSDKFVVGAEDSDFGLQLQSHGLHAAYISEMKIYHKEPQSLKSYLRKKIAYSGASDHLAAKWNIKEIQVNKVKQMKMASETFRAVSQQLPSVKKIFVFYLVTLDYIFSRFHLYGLLKV